ncbi:MAG: hypothetical protein JWP87_3846 [Labilithrix sp.]|jgi:hypothetical protein|nr:hypothetical protein [Labilithrix sp.]
MNSRPLLVLAAIAAATSPDMGKGALDRFKGNVRDGFARDPMGSVLATVLGGAWLFYKAERGHNPKVKSYYDALVYVSTNLSVGYSDIFAKTPRGKAIGTALMTYGPAMAAKIFDAPSAPAPVAAAPAAPAASTGSKDVLDRLDRILAVLEANRAEAKRPTA